MGLLEKLRNRRNVEKRIISFNIAFFLTLLIFIIWVVGTFYDFGDREKVRDDKISPTKSITQSVRSFFSTAPQIYIPDDIFEIPGEADQSEPGANVEAPEIQDSDAQDSGAQGSDAEPGAESENQSENQLEI